MTTNEAFSKLKLPELVGTLANNKESSVIESHQLIKNAENQIVDILIKLEQDTGMQLENISLEDIDITTLIDKTPQYLRSIKITMEKQPKISW